MKPAGSMKMDWKQGMANLGLSLGTVVFFLGVVEIGLRLSGFSYVLYPEEIEFGAPDPVVLKTGFLEDDDVFWVTKDYPEKLERLRRERPSVIFMGDSCTHFGTYDRELDRLVTQRSMAQGSGSALRYGNLGVPGWTSYQGLRQMERDVVGLAPEVVTIYYGWNDHWIGFGLEDKNIRRIKRIFSSGWSGLRLVQLATRALVAAGTRETEWPNRVSLEDYRSNLREMTTLASAAGIRPLLLTAPTSIREGAEPDYLAGRWLEELSDLVPLHRSYVEVVRQVASEEGAPLCDLDRRFAELPRPEIEASFMADGIHLTEEGSRRVAEFLYECLGFGISSEP